MKVGKSRDKSSKNLPKNTFKIMKLKGGSGKITKRKVGRIEQGNTLMMYGFTLTGTEFSKCYGKDRAREEGVDSDERDKEKGGNGLNTDGKDEMMTMVGEEIAGIE